MKHVLLKQVVVDTAVTTGGSVMTLESLSRLTTAQAHTLLGLGTLCFATRVRCPYILLPCRSLVSFDVYAFSVFVPVQSLFFDAVALATLRGCRLAGIYYF